MMDPAVCTLPGSRGLGAISPEALARLARAVRPAGFPEFIR
jgi:hypothetical protein